MIFTIAQHECLKLFKTGKIWKWLAICQFILGLIFYWLMEEFFAKTQNLLLANEHSLGITEEVIHPLFAWTALFFFFITPLLATNSLTQERKMHTLNLYFTSAVSSTDIVLGKFIGLFVAELFLLMPVFIMPVIILFQDQLDLGQYVAGLFGLILLLGATLSLGIFVSSFFQEPIIVTLINFLTLFLLSLLEWAPRFLDLHFQWFTEFALLYHSKNFLSGVINTQDILYYCMFSMVLLYLAILRLNKEAKVRGKR